MRWLFTEPVSHRQSGRLGLYASLIGCNSRRRKVHQTEWARNGLRSVQKSMGGSTLGQGARPQIHLLPPPQIQKLADRSDVISEVPKCSRIQIFRGSAPDTAGGAYSAPQTS